VNAGVTAGLKEKLAPGKEPEKDAIDDSVVVGFSVIKEGCREGLEIEGNREGCSEDVGWLEREGTKEGDEDGIIMIKVFTSFPLKNPPSPINLPPTFTS